MRTFYKLVRTVSAVTLFFFCWTYLSVYQVVAFAAEEQRAAKAREESAGPRTPGERLEKALEDIRENMARAREKSARNENTGPEMASFKSRKAEIEALNSEIEREFADTEKRIRDNNLPQEILDRHARFVKQYQENLKQVRTDLDNIELARTKEDAGRNIEKAKANLDKVKPARKRAPIDPNFLPHRQVKAKEKAPRIKTEEFEKEFGPVAAKTPQLAAKPKTWTRAGSARNEKPLLLAFNGPDSDIAFSASAQPSDGRGSLSRLRERAGLMTAFDPALFDNGALPLLAQAALDMPAAADLAETVEVKFTPAIRAKAQELGYRPAKIYEWVENNIEFVPTYGSIQGADMCLRTKQCNAFDTASLLIALLRASNVPARYLYGTVELPMEKVANWVGQFTDTRAALNMMASGGIPVRGLTTGGKITAAQMEHIWVEAWIDYNPSRGAVQNQGDTWIPLDASIKQYDYIPGADMAPALASAGFNMETLLNEANSTAVKDEVNLSATSVNTGAIATNLDAARIGLVDYFKQNKPDANVGDILGRRAIRQQKFEILPASLPAAVVAQPVRFSAIPASLQHSISVRLISNDLFGEDAFSAVLPLPGVSASQITLSYFPATAADEQIASNYGGILKTPAYLLQLKAFLKVDGAVRASGGPVTLGDTQSLRIQFYGPGMNDAVEHDVIAGGYYAVTLNTGSMAADQLNDRKKKLRDIIQAGQATKDESLGQILYTWGLAYFLQVSMFEHINGKTLGVENVKIGSEGLVGTSISVQTLFGIPRTTTFSGFTIDVKRDVNAPFAKDGNKEKVKAFMLTTGLYGSSLENGIFEETMKTQGVSAVKLLRVANDNGIPIYYMNKSNIASILPKLSLPADDIRDIQNAVNAGKIVYAPQRTINYGSFSGIGYLVLEPETGAGAYLISGGLGVLYGGSAAPDPSFQALVTICNWIRDTLAVLLSLAGGVAGVMADFAALVGDTFMGLINGTASGSDIALSIAIWAAGTAFSLWLGSQTLALVLAAAIFGGTVLGPVGVIIGAIVAVVLLVAIQVAMYFLVKYLTDSLLLSWLRDILHAARSLFADIRPASRGVPFDTGGAYACHPG